VTTHEYLMDLLGEIRRHLDPRNRRRDIYAMYEAIVVELIREHHGEELAHLWRLIKAEASRQPWRAKLAIAQVIGRASKKHLAVRAEPSGQLAWSFEPVPQGDSTAHGNGARDAPAALPSVVEDTESGQYRFQWVSDLVSGQSPGDTHEDSHTDRTSHSMAPTKGNQTSQPTSDETHGREWYLNCLEELLRGHGPVRLEWRESKNNELRMTGFKLLFLIRVFRDLS